MLSVGFMGDPQSAIFHDNVNQRNYDTKETQKRDLTYIELNIRLVGVVLRSLIGSEDTHTHTPP